MLVLSRKEGESIEFRDLDVSVRIIQLKKSKVQLGIEAPRAIQVDRSETLEGRDGVESRSDHFGVGRIERQTNRKQIRTNHPQSEQRLLDELAKLEVEVMTLAELVTSKDQDLARQTALVSLERLYGLRKILKGVSNSHPAPRSISDFIQTRQCECNRVESANGSTSDGAVQGKQELNSSFLSQSRIDCLRQTGVGYFLDSDVSVLSERGSFEAGSG